ncbi:hypothetical protein EFR46_08330, partial [Lactobacillus delbrueckii subsp. bulgaricus]|uniref:hypothetical protein n=2 Tax=Lactobacillus delbrueckii TaxID=1584 RepID=UPI0021A82E19
VHRLLSELILPVLLLPVPPFDFTAFQNYIFVSRNILAGIPADFQTYVFEVWVKAGIYPKAKFRISLD